MAASVVCGLALGVAFPDPGWAGLAWIAPGGMLLAAAGQGGWGSFRVGYAAGLAFNLVALRWILNIPFPVGAVAGWIALAAYLALFQGVWVCACCRLLPAPPVGGSEAVRWAATMDALLAGSWVRRTGWTLTVAAVWVGLEMIQSRLFSGFPWTALGVTQFRLVPLTQLAAWTGVAGLSFLLVWTAASLSLALVRLAREPSARWGWMSEVRVPLLVVAALGCAGMLRLEPDPAGGPALRLALVQPSIPQKLIWDREKDGERFDHILRLSELAVQGQPDVLVWPESALPDLTEANYRAITNLVIRHRVWMVLGADDAESRRGTKGEETDYFNAAFLLTPQGRVAASYRKQHLVIFGEYVPLVRWLPLIRYVTPIDAGFTEGAGPVVFSLDRPAVRMSPLICFEDVFAPQVRRHAADTVDILLNVTNNGWFGRGSAQIQHAANATFRAIENGLPLVRCTNDGLTCWIDRYGRVRQWLGEKGGDLHAAGFLQVNVPLGGARSGTFYSRHGEVFGWGCAALAGLAALAVRRGTTTRAGAEV